jgi:hypothetical protein
MEAGQYIIITHNDAIIMESNVLYGVSMQDGVSKVLSLKLDDAKSLARSVEQEEKERQKVEQIEKKPDEIDIEENLEDMSEESKEEFK